MNTVTQDVRLRIISDFPDKVFTIYDFEDICKAHGVNFIKISDSFAVLYRSGHITKTERIPKKTKSRGANCMGYKVTDLEGLKKFSSSAKKKHCEVEEIEESPKPTNQMLAANALDAAMRKFN